MSLVHGDVERLTGVLGGAVRMDGLPSIDYTG